MKFSIIVPMLNCQDTIERLLDSIIEQEHNEDYEVEILLCDDGCHDNTFKRIKYYENSLNIIFCKQDKYSVHCPGNTRNIGLDNMTGDWVLFLDHDDYLDKKALDTFKKIIDEKSCKTMIYTKRFTYVEDEGIEKEDEIFTSYIHGKCYNVQFLKDNNITFKENLFGHEDLYFNNTCECFCTEQELEWIIEQIPTYHWTSSNDSTSGIIYVNDNSDYFERTAKDYADALIEPFISRGIDDAYHMCKCIDALFYLYLYYEKYNYRAVYELEQEDRMEYFKDYIYSYIKQILNTFSIKLDEMISLMYRTNEFYYLVNDVIQHDCIGHEYVFRPFIPTTTLKDFILGAFPIEELEINKDDIEVVEESNEDSNK